MNTIALIIGLSLLVLFIVFIVASMFVLSKKKNSDNNNEPIETIDKKQISAEMEDDWETQFNDMLKKPNESQ